MLKCNKCKKETPNFAYDVNEGYCDDHAWSEPTTTEPNLELIYQYGK